MLKAVFGKCPQVKTMDFLLSTYDGIFNKTQLANGSEISRPTLDKFIDNLVKYGLVNEVAENLFELNENSEVVKLFGKSNLLLAEISADIQLKNPINHEKYSDDEIDGILSDVFDEDDLTEEEYQEKIAKEEDILVKKKNHEQAIIREKIANNKIKKYSKIQSEINGLKEMVIQIKIDLDKLKRKNLENMNTNYGYDRIENNDFSWDYKNKVNSIYSGV